MDKFYVVPTSDSLISGLRGSSVLPDRPFHKFRASRSGDRLISCTSSDGFKSSKIGKNRSGYRRVGRVGWWFTWSYYMLMLLHMLAYFCLSDTSLFYLIACLQIKTGVCLKCSKLYNSKF